MPVYEYECKDCEKIFEVKQRIADEPLKKCPECGGNVSKIMSMSSFQLKGGGWYADGYSSASNATQKKPQKPASSPCAASSGCAGCPAAPSS